MSARTLIALIVSLGILPATAAPPASLRATTESQIIQNDRADRDHLSRMKDTGMLNSWKRLELLVPVPSRTRGYYVHSVPSKYRYLRPWAKLFLDRLGSQFRARFGRPLRVTSLTRTVTYQKSLSRRNGNAASAFGEKRSAHLTGASLDISKKGMTRAQRSWVRRVLISLRQKGYLFAVEEFYQPNFHVLVHRHYPEWVAKLEARAKSRNK